MLENLPVLIADDDPASRRLLETLLNRWGYATLQARDGLEAWDLLQAEDAPQLVILDWMMPLLDGPALCRKIREADRARPVYIIMLTSRREKEDIVEGLSAGADEFIVKPFDLGELRARVGVGARVVRLQSELAERVRELQEALASVRQLQGLLPICGYCKRIRDDRNYWQQVDEYLSEHADVQFSHGVCPECYQKILRPQIDALDPQADEEAPG